ncbi:thioredoxin domain-containing protein [uncultured Friedmanniella sp.]|uniref:thioredoxin domain-containing protein n=1 Tax=uncultured Friedmanniella sp. TaxID=335381 RepID=UPI0035CAE802
MNRLRWSRSPYLLQHQDNPVDWYEWGPEAFARAAERDVPVLLSVGYAACHWCHVMAHESFEDPELADLLNRDFVAVKVDREERPDVDAVYMRATQAMTGQGGWPMTVFLTPDRRPFYAGTYFPPQPRHGLPSFGQLLEELGSAWRERRSEVQESAGQIVQHLAGQAVTAMPGELTEAGLDRAVELLRADFDPEHAGFGGAPKFPPSMVLEALLRDGTEDAVAMAGQTLTAMARGGIYDQLAGGFARYSVDAGWVVPHFEKMLYDNALLLGAYTHWWRVGGSELAGRVVTETVTWLLGEMRTPEGGFAASLDADSLPPSASAADAHAEEGAFYVWTQGELRQALGAADGDWAAAAFGVTEAGTFEHGRSTLQLEADPDPVRLADIRTRLAAARGDRPRPGRDDKVVAAWNGWTVDALVTAAMVFDRPDWLDAAREAADLLWRLHWVEDRLRRTSRAGEVGQAPGILEDYAALAMAATRLASALADPTWIERARLLLDVVLEVFDDGGTGFFDTASDAEQLYARPQDPTDNATPSGLSGAVHALQLFAQLTGEDAYAERAERAAASAGGLVARAPRFAGWLLADAVSRLRPAALPVQVAVVGVPGPERDALVRTAYRAAAAGSVVVAGEGDRAGFALLADRAALGGLATAYVCQHFVCRLPVTSSAALGEQLGTSCGLRPPGR